MSDYNERLISMAGGDGEADVLGEIEARDKAVGPLSKQPHLSESQEALLDRRALLAMVREQRAVIERVEAVLTAIETHASLDSSPVEYRTVGGWVDVEDALTAALIATEGVA